MNPIEWGVPKVELSARSLNCIEKLIRRRTVSLTDARPSVTRVISDKNELRVTLQEYAKEDNKTIYDLLIAVYGAGPQTAKEICDYIGSNDCPKEHCPTCTCWAKGHHE